MAKKENRFKDYDITTQAIHTGTDYDKETGAVRRPLHMANSYKLPDDLSQVNYSSTCDPSSDEDSPAPPLPPLPSANPQSLLCDPLSS